MGDKRPAVLWKVSDVMHELNVSRAWVWRRVKDGALKAIRLGNGKRRTLRFDPAEVRKLKVGANEQAA